MDERKRKILQAIIHDYIMTAEPVGSRTIARKYDMGVGPATIRNEMADLEVQGYLEQPHTSAGRVPSAKGYRFYVDALLSPTQMSDNDLALIRNWYDAKVRNLDEVFLATAKVLSRLTRNVSLVVAPQYSHTTFKYLQFLPFDEQRVLLLVVTDSGFVENKVIDKPADTTIEDLQRVAAMITNRLTGQPLHRIKTTLLRQIRQDLFQNDQALFENALHIVDSALSQEREKRIYCGGTAQLLRQPEFQDVAKVKNLLDLLDQDKLMCDILDAPEKDGVIVTIGHENKYSGIQDYSVVQATYRIEGQVVGTVAVMGPTRMDYGKVMSVLGFMHDHLGDLLKKYKNGG